MLVPRPWHIRSPARYRNSLFVVVFASTSLVVDGESFELWWRTGSPIVLLGVALGAAVYAPTTVYGRALAISAMPTLRRPS